MADKTKAKAKPRAKNKGGKPGRQLIEIDEKQVLALAEIGCTAAEIGVVVGASYETIHRRFDSLIAKGRENLKERLRRVQIKVALSGDRTMLIWLGKQMLGQRDEAKLELSGAVKIETEVILTQADPEAPE